MALAATTPFRTGLSDRSALYEELDERFARYEKNREQVAEEKWQRNIDAFKCAIEPESGRKRWKKGEGEGWRSKTRLAVTRQKIYAAFAIICDVVLSGGKIPYCLKVDRQFQTEEDVFEDPLVRMTDVIDGQLEHTRADRDFFRALFSALIYGEAWQKRQVRGVDVQGFEELTLGPEFAGVSLPPELRRFAPTTRKATMPAAAWVSPWCLYWDMEARDVEDMAGIFHRQDCSLFELRRMAREPGADAQAIERVIEAERGRTDNGRADARTLEPRLRELAHRSRTVRRLEYWGRASRKAVEDYERRRLEEGGAGLDELGGLVRAADAPGLEEDGDEVYIMAVLAGEELVKLARIEPGDVPFSRFLCEEDLESPLGRSPADNLEQVQMVLDGAIRAFEDNKRLSANFILFVKRFWLAGGKLEDKIGRMGVVVDVADDCPDARQAAYAPVFPDHGANLLDAIQLFLQFADSESNISAIAQGQPDADQGGLTATEANIRSEKAQKYFGTIIRNLDLGWIEPLIGWMLKYNLADPERAAAAGPFHAQATGFTSFQSRYVRVQRIQQLLALVAQDEELRALCKMDQMLAELFKFSDVDPDQFLYSPQELEDRRRRQMLEQQQQMQQQAALEQQAQDAAQQSPEAQARLREMDARAAGAEQRNALEAERARAQTEQTRARTVAALAQAARAEGGA